MSCKETNDNDSISVTIHMTVEKSYGYQLLFLNEMLKMKDIAKNGSSTQFWIVLQSFRSTIGIKDFDSFSILIVMIILF